MSRIKIPFIWNRYSDPLYAFTYALRAYFLMRSLPGKYDAKKVKEWKTKYDAIMRTAPQKVAALYRASKD